MLCFIFVPQLVSCKWKVGELRVEELTHPLANSPTHPLYTVNVQASLLLSPLDVITERNPFSPVTVPA